MAFRLGVAEAAPRPHRSGYCRLSSHRLLSLLRSKDGWSRTHIVPGFPRIPTRRLERVEASRHLQEA